MHLEFFDSITRSSEGVWFPLRDPRTGNATDIEFKLAGPDSQIYRNAERNILKLRAARLRNNGDDTLAFTDEEKVELITPCILGWKNLEEGGCALTYSPAAVRDVLTRYPIILRQLDAIIGDARNFLREVSENLQPGQGGDSGCSATPGGDALTFIRELEEAGCDLEPEDVEPELWEQGGEVLEFFWQLHAARGGNGYGPNPVSFSELAAFQSLTGQTLSPWLIAQIRMLDNLYFKTFAEMMRNRPPAE